MELRILQGTNVDLISPFPLSEVKRMYGWLHCYRTVTEGDDTPQGIDARCGQMAQALQGYVSWGVIDKNHLTNIKHEAPLVGFIAFEPVLGANGVCRDGYLHVATARRAWKARLIDESGELVLKELFLQVPSLLRLSCRVAERNAPAKALCKRLGFKVEGVEEDSYLLGGSPCNVVLFGLTRRNYEWHSNTITPSVTTEQYDQMPQSPLLEEE